MDEFYLGIRIKIARKQAGFSQAELAKALDITVNSINRYEKGHRKPDAGILSRMVEILRCDPAWLLVGPRKDMSHGERSFSYGGETAGEKLGESYGVDIVTERIILILKEMPEEARREILRSLEEKKLLTELLEERRKLKDKG